MDLKSIFETPAYDFLRTHPRLGDRIILAGVSGSYGYGTNREGSDIDLRGVTLNLPSDLIGLTSFEQFEDRTTDTVIYSFRKLVHLLLSCNPNTIEILGLPEENYVIKTELGQSLLDHSSLFLSKRAASSFGHYADAQLRRLENALARDSLPQSEKEEHIFRSVTHALEDFEGRNRQWEGGGVHTYIDDAEKEGLEKEIFLDVDLHHVSLRRYADLINTMSNVIRDYDRIGKRNHKKDDNHLNKHAMHLIRLFMMAIDILEEGEIRTRREGEDLALLKEIRKGSYMEEGVFIPAFYELVRDYEKRLEEAWEQSLLPDQPDMEKVEAFVEEINLHALGENR